MKIYKFIYVWVPLFLWMLMIFSFSSVKNLPSVDFIWWDFLMKKTAHFVEFSILCLLWIRAFHLWNGYHSMNKKMVIMAIIASILYAFTDEFHQIFTPGRTPKVQDVLIDTSGILFTAFIFSKYKVIQILS